MKTNKIFFGNKTNWFFWISLFCLVNGSLFTWLFKGTPLSAWRQLIWMIGLLILAYAYPVLRQNKKFKRLQRWHFIAFYYILLSSLIAIGIYGFNIVRIAYGFWLYFAGLPFILFPFIIAEKRLITAKRFYWIFTCLGIFLSAGLFIDYFTDGLFTNTFLIGANEDLEGLLEEKRYCFLAEAPTTFGVYYCFCMVCAIMSIYLSKNFLTKLLLLFVIFLYIAASWVTGSRQIVAVLLSTVLISLLYYLFLVRDQKTFLIVGLLAFLAYIPNIVEYVTSQKSYETRYSEKALQEDKRSDNWLKGWNETVVNHPEVFLFGHGATYIQGQKAQPGEICGSHYENTYFSRLNELGIVGLFLLLFPTIFLLRNWKKASLFYVLMLSLNIAFLITCFVSPNGNAQTTQTIMYIATGMVLYSDYFDVVPSSNRITRKTTGIILNR